MIRLFFTFFVYFYSTGVNAQVVQADSLILVNFYNATNGPAWKDNTNWLTGPVHTWSGISLENNRVTGIQFSNELKGSLPDELTSLTKLKYLQFFNATNLTGTLPEKIGNCQDLILLTIRWSKITGEIPKSITRLKNLKTLELHGLLSGGIPDSINQLSELETFSLASNKLTGSLPASLYQLKKLKYLSMTGNKLSGSVSTALNNLTFLEYLLLDGNLFSGNFPSIRNLTKLVDILIDKNSFTGNLDTILGVHSQMEYCYVYQNKFSGSISPTHFNTNKLIQLLMDNNDIQKMGDFSLFAQSPKFHSIDIKENRLHFDDLIPNLVIGKKIISFPQKPLTNDTIITLKPGDSYTLTSPLTGKEVNHTWYKNGIKINGSTANQILISSFTSTASGEYKFVARHPLVTSQDSLVSGSMKIIEQSTNTNEIAIQAYKITYQWEDQKLVIKLPSDAGKSRVRVVSLNGNNMLDKILYTSDTTVSLQALPAGIYIVNLISHGGYRNKKIIKL